MGLELFPPLPRFSCLSLIFCFWGALSFRAVCLSDPHSTHTHAPLSAAPPPPPPPLARPLRVCVCLSACPVLARLFLSEYKTCAPSREDEGTRAFFSLLRICPCRCVSRERTRDVRALPTPSLFSPHSHAEACQPEKCASGGVTAASLLLYGFPCLVC